MSRPPAPKELSLKWLELFEVCANKGSLQATARDTGLTISTVSYHIRNLEAHLGVELFDHTRRPMVLTPKGQAFLHNIGDALSTIRKAKAEASAGNLTEASRLRFGTIEDFDSDIVPELAVFLSAVMPNCAFMYHTDSSHAVLDLLRTRHLDLGITVTPDERVRDLRDRPLLRDPFVIVLPRASEHAPRDALEGRSPLPFLRFSSGLIIARQIETHLRRIGISPPRQFECSNTQTLMAMVAAGAGWTITTPLLFSRAQRFQSRLQMHPFPGKHFARSLAVVATPDCSASMVDLVDARVRRLITEHAVRPLHRSAPWLVDSFGLIQ